MRQRLHPGWVMVFSAMGILAVNSQPYYSFGIFLKTMTGELGWERGAMSLAISITMLVSNPLSILTGRLSDKYGPRIMVTASGFVYSLGYLLMSYVQALWQVYLIFGVLIAVGGALCSVPLTSTIPRWFTKRRSVALGLTYAGMTVGGIIGPFLTQWIIDIQDWRWAYRVFAIMTLVVFVPLSQLLKRSPGDSGMKPYGETGETESIATESAQGFSYRQALRTRWFWLFGGILLCQFFVGQTLVGHIAPHITDLGISATMAAGVLSIYAATSLVGTNLSGIMIERLGLKRMIVVSFSLVLLLMVWLIFSRTEWMFYFFAVFYGLTFGLLIPLQTVVPGELFGLKSLGSISATLMFIGAIGGAIGSPLAGAIFDTRGSYFVAFLICTGINVVAIILSIVLLRSRDKEVPVQ